MPCGWDAKPVACPWDPSKAMTALWGGGGALALVACQCGLPYCDYKLNNKSLEFDMYGKLLFVANREENEFNNKSLAFDIYDGLLSFTNGEENIQSSDFMMDFNMGELYFYNLLISSYLSDLSCVFNVAMTMIMDYRSLQKNV